MTKLTNRESEKLEGLLTYKEISNVLLIMKPDKSPGIKGVNAFFFQSFLEAVRAFCITVYISWL